MNARTATSMDGSLLMRKVLGVCIALCVAACSSQHAIKQEKDAATYNTQLGIAYLRQGEIPLAKEKLDRALQQNPSNPGVHSARAMLYDRLGDPAKADSEFQTALHLAPHDPELLNNYAVYLCRTGRTDEGVRRFGEAAHNALYRTPEAAYTNAGVCLHSAKRDEEAARNFKQALIIRPNFSEAAYQLSDLEFRGGKLLEARAQIDSYIGAFPATPDLLLLGVRITRAQGDRLGTERYARKLRLDFPGTDQARALADLDRNPG
ncbi:MAG: type pilus assembly protein PilF [Gammaproteobacteria bacterium]|nr:type pilus assembly protein PilF [Gammaproteobacteria bacterium]